MARLTGKFAFALWTALNIGMPSLAADDSAQVPAIEVIPNGDGSIQIEGKQYHDAGPLRTKLLEIEARKPRPYLAIEAKGNINFTHIGKAILLIEEAGVPLLRVGFLTEPRSLQDIGPAIALRTAQLKCKVAASDNSLRWHVRRQGVSWHVWTGNDDGACGSMSVAVNAQTGTPDRCIEVVCTNYRDRTPVRHGTVER